MNKEDIESGLLAILFGIPCAIITIYVANNQVEFTKLREQSYAIADTNHNYVLEDSELIQLAKGMELIKEGEIITIDEVKSKIKSTDGAFGDTSSFKKYLAKQRNY
jgi:threonine aldolase